MKNAKCGPKFEQVLNNRQITNKSPVTKKQKPVTTPDTGFCFLDLGLPFTLPFRVRKQANAVGIVVLLTAKEVDGTVTADVP